MKGNTSFVEVNDEPLHKEIYKNNHVRIYRVILKPGDSTSFHRHSKNTLYVSICGGRITTKIMKKTPSCATVLSKNLSLSTRLVLLFQKVFFYSIHIFSGFIFYMPSKNYPVIHKAIASSFNLHNMDLLGIEILSSNIRKLKAPVNYDKIEIETDEIIVYRLYIKSKKKLDESQMQSDGLIIVLSGKLDIEEKGQSISLGIGDFFWTGSKILKLKENQYSEQIEILYVIFKK